MKCSHCTKQKAVFVLPAPDLIAFFCWACCDVGVYSSGIARSAFKKLEYYREKGEERREKHRRRKRPSMRFVPKVI